MDCVQFQDIEGIEFGVFLYSLRKLELHLGNCVVELSTETASLKREPQFVESALRLLCVPQVLLWCGMD